MPAPDPDAITAAFPTIGPFDTDTSQAAARVIDNLSRYLVYATRTADGVPDPNTLAVVLGDLHAALGRLPDVLRQLHRRFTDLSSQPAARLAPAFDADHPETLRDARTWFAGDTEDAANLITDAGVHLSDLCTLADLLATDPDE